jgi:ATP synthase protein I
MPDQTPPKTPRSDPAFLRQVGASAQRKLEARSETISVVWSGLGMMGLIGWSVALPALLGAGLGRWLDARNPGRHSLTLALLVAGIILGCVNAWHWVARQDEAMRGGRR